MSWNSSSTSTYSLSVKFTSVSTSSPLRRAVVTISQRVVSIQRRHQGDTTMIWPRRKYEQQRYSVEWISGSYSEEFDKPASLTQQRTSTRSWTNEGQKYKRLAVALALVGSLTVTRVCTAPVVQWQRSTGWGWGWGRQSHCLSQVRSPTL